MTDLDQEVETARLKFAVPAQKWTARSVQQTKQAMLWSAVAITSGGVICLRPETGWSIVWVMCAIQFGVIFTEWIRHLDRNETDVEVDE